MNDDPRDEVESVLNSIFKNANESPSLMSWMPEPGAVAPPLTVEDLKAVFDAMANEPYRPHTIDLPPTPENRRMLKHRQN